MVCCSLLQEYFFSFMNTSTWLMIHQGKNFRCCTFIIPRARVIVKLNIGRNLLVSDFSQKHIWEFFLLPWRLKLSEKYIWEKYETRFHSERKLSDAFLRIPNLRLEDSHHYSRGETNGFHSDNIFKVVWETDFLIQWCWVGFLSSTHKFLIFDHLAIEL